MNTPKDKTGAEPGQPLAGARFSIHASSTFGAGLSFPQRGLAGVQDPAKSMTAQLALESQKQGEHMFCKNNTTTSMTVKISAPFKLEADQRKVFVDSLFVNIAAPAGRQDGDYLYSASVTILRENNAVYTTAPMWANVDVEAMGATQPGRRDA